MRWTGLRLQSGIIAFRVSHYSEPEVTTKIQLARLASYSEHGGTPTTMLPPSLFPGQDTYRLLSMASNDSADHKRTTPPKPAVTNEFPSGENKAANILSL